MSGAHDTQLHATDDAPVALITGGARRIGRAIVLRLHRDGYRVLVHCHQSTDAADQLVADLNRQRGGAATRLNADLNDTAATRSLADAALATYGRMDLLVNNASSFYPTPLTSLQSDPAFDDQAWHELMGSNLRAPLTLAAALAEPLKKMQGAVVNIVDIHAKSALADHHVYCAAKAGLASLTRTLALAMGPDVRVNGVAPGAILWPEATPSSVEAEQSIRDGTALQRMGTPDDIAAAVAFLASRRAAYVSGQVIAVDGGRHLYQY